jgi:hypothetical protein
MSCSAAPGRRPRSTAGSTEMAHSLWCVGVCADAATQPDSQAISVAAGWSLLARQAGGCGVVCIIIRAVCMASATVASVSTVSLSGSTSVVE